MATASTVPPTVVNSRPPSQFGQFRGVTQIINTQTSTPNAPTTSAHVHPASKSTTTNPSGMDQMAQASRPSSGQQIERNGSVVPSRSVPPDRAVSNAPQSTNQLELVELSSNPLIEGVLGPNKDGRVRNPVPSKLKGKTDNKQGNFGVMHMGTSPGKRTEAQAKDSAAERDAAARRTSENTASRARAAQQEKYIPPKKRGIEASMSEPGNRSSPLTISRNVDRPRARPLAPDETKFEQARLLTLLRSINPVTVVDQICKAIAYFGGIPGAPPPEDGIFPESANTRETGALFIGWIAEIFPDLSARTPEVAKEAPGASSKKRSRPSIGKKGGEAGERETPNSQNGYGYGPAVSAPAWGLPPSLALVNTPVPVPVAEASQPAGFSYEQDKPSTSGPSMPTTTKPQSEDANTEASNKRRRGRPKGSKNKGGKAEGTLGEGNESGSQHVPTEQPHQSNDAAITAVADSGPTGYPTTSNQTNTKKADQSYQYPPQSWSNTQRHTNGASIPPHVDELSPEERAVLEAFRSQGGDNSAGAISAPVPQMTGAAGAPQAGNEKKRKRPPNKPKSNQPPIMDPGAPAPITVMKPTDEPLVTTTQPSGASVSMSQAQPTTSTWSSVSTSTAAPPPTKKPRVRKPKATTASETPAKKQTTSIVNNATPVVSASALPESQVVAPSLSQPVSRPPADGLEAHYERFANFQQQNGRSNTPTQPQHQRQQSKPSSVPPQQSTPQISNQPMQQQKSQQGTQVTLGKEDQKLTQPGPPSRAPTTTTYYGNQRAQSIPYGQQYPSQHSSQLYSGHQASPQIHNGSVVNNANSMTSTNTLSNTNASPSNYNRAYGTHSLAQASPQFSQPETSYRTNSPHVAQPSPSFNQNDNNFRSNTHTIAQSAPSYTHTDTSYRAPTTHAMPQSSPSYPSSRTHSQSQATHQNHYNGFSDSSFIDLPTLDSLGHTGAANPSNVGMGVGNYNQGLGVGGNARSSSTSNSLYGTSSGLGNAYDGANNDLLRGVSRSTSNANPNGGFANASSGLSQFDTTTASEHEMRERLMRGLGRR